jgi:hypothetical protein
MNSRKWTHDEKILDPFEVQDDWFEVQLGTWQLLITDNIPRGQRDRARFTLDRLRLDTGDDAVRVRRDYYDDFITGDFTLTALTRVAPLVARAVKRVLEPLQPPLDEAQHYCQFLVGEISVIKLEKDAPIIAGVVRSRLPGCSRRFPV